MSWRFRCAWWRTRTLSQPGASDGARSVAAKRLSKPVGCSTGRCGARQSTGTSAELCERSTQPSSESMRSEIHEPRGRDGRAEGRRFSRQLDAALDAEARSPATERSVAVTGVVDYATDGKKPRALEAGMSDDVRPRSADSLSARTAALRRQSTDR